MTDLTIRRWDKTTFLTGRDEWNRLLGQSSADPLFLSWEWIATWWEVFGVDEDVEPAMLGAYTSDGRLLALAPLYVHRTRLRNALPIRRLQFMGNCWRTEGSVRSEYIDLIADRGSEERAFRAIFDYLARELEWDEFVACNLLRNSITSRSLTDYFGRSKRYLLRELERGESSAVLLETDFTSFLASLGPRLRRDMYNQRKRLELHGQVQMVSADEDTLEEFFGTLNSFHERRWGKPVFTGKRLEFHSRLAGRLLEEGRLNFTCLRIGDRPISALYHFRVNGVEYGYQLGFDPEFDRRLSPALLHIGYTIERSYGESLRAYDLLRGTGKKQSYKDRFCVPFKPLHTIQIVRAPVLKWLYRLNAAWPRWQARASKEQEEAAV